MNQQGDSKNRPGTSLLTWGIVALVLGVILLVMNLATTNVDFVPGAGTVETRGTPSAGAIGLLVIGLLLSGFGFGRRILAAVERR